ncbi:hypothetical protein WJX81_004876 [Elliptochloris bilobata]|uniref:Trehalase n=1 Tax=Elliptochloris bilobata TaxID=381761 RepID=A0AAW1S381_9CHLO
MSASSPSAAEPLRRRWRKLWGKLSLAEISGAFGDLGTFLPLLVGLVQATGMDLGTTLLATGMYNIALGAAFGIPLPVQPMKAIAAVAISGEGLDLAEVAAAGVFVSGVVFLLGVTRLINIFNRLVPTAVVRGVQLSVGLQLTEKGLRAVWFTASQERDLQAAAPRALLSAEEDEQDSAHLVYLGLAAAAFLLLTLYPGGEADRMGGSPKVVSPPAQEAASLQASGDLGRLEGGRGGGGALEGRLAAGGGGGVGGARRPPQVLARGLVPNRDSSASLNTWLGREGSRPASVQGEEALGAEKVGGLLRHVPAALLVVITGLVVTAAQYPAVLRALRLGPSLPGLIFPTGRQWANGILRAGLPQLPLTTLNSVISVSQLSEELFTGRGASPAALSLAIGAMNAAGAWMGAMPCCCGAGGLAAQVRFGARSGAAPMFLGAVKMALGLLFGNSLFRLLRAFPRPLLGSMLVFSGVELASNCRGVTSERGMAFMLLTAATSLGLRSVSHGFLAGMAAAALSALADAAPLGGGGGGAGWEPLLGERGDEGTVRGGAFFQRGAGGWHAARPLLEAVQSAMLFSDSKTFVDMPLMVEPAVALSAFAELVSKSKGTPLLRATVQEYVETYFSPPGSDLEVLVPPDFAEQPVGFLPALTEADTRAWALAVHRLWSQLCWKEMADVAAHPERHTLLPLPAWGIIPGARFREVYYWDSLWVVRGLLVSGMHATAQAEVCNLLALLSAHGHVPNGARSYYVNRRHPPLLSRMVATLHAATGDLALVREAFPLLVTEHAYWTSAPKLVQVRGGSGRVHRLSRYYAAWSRPRPESFCEDTALAAGLGPAAAAALFRELASGAESGWDYSSRWCSDWSSIATLRVTSVLPTDLNAFLFALERDLATFAELLGYKDAAGRFKSAGEARRAAMQELMFDEERGCWHDLVISAEEDSTGVCATAHAPGVFASDYVPLWAGLVRAGSAHASAVATSLQRSGLLRAGGAMASLTETGQQWDAPNAWPPLQALLIEGLAAYGGAGGAALARRLAQAWLANVRAAWQRTGKMAEKHDATCPGKAGGGGEYPVQIGFGWTNGVALCLLHQYGWNPGEAGFD